MDKWWSNEPVEAEGSKWWSNDPVPADDTAPEAPAAFSEAAPANRDAPGLVAPRGLADALAGSGIDPEASQPDNSVFLPARQAAPPSPELMQRYGLDTAELDPKPEPERPPERTRSSQLAALDRFGRNAMREAEALKPPDPDFSQVDDNPDGTAVGRAVRRGGLRMAASVPLALAQADATAIADSKMSSSELLRNAFLQATRLEAVPEGVSLETPEKASEAMMRLGYPPQTINDFRAVYYIRAQHAADAVADPERALRRGAQNLHAGGSLIDRAASLPMSPAAERMKLRLAQDKTIGGTLAAMARNPSEAASFLAELGVESTPQIAGAMAVGAVTRSPAASVAVMSVGGLASEYGSSVSEFLTEKGVSLKTEQDAIQLLNDPETMSDAAERGLTRGLVIAAFDAMGLGLAGKQFVKSPLGDALVQATLQAATGSAGEAAAQKASGQEFNSQEVLLEGLAGIVTAPAEVATAAASSRGSRTQVPDRLTPDDRASPLRNDVINQGKTIVDELLSGTSDSKGAINAEILYGKSPTAEPVAPVSTAEVAAPVMPEAVAPVAPEPEAVAPVAPEPVPQPEPVSLEPVAQPEPAPVVAPESVAPVSEDPAPQLFPEENVPSQKLPRPQATPDDLVVLRNADLAQIKTDPETFQYKSNGDDQGVTDRLRGVKKWDKSRAGIVTVYEYADGRRVIADGHQRLGLAKRAAADGQDVQLRAEVVREVDGVTPKDAMVSAALNNIAQGSGTAIDAAKVLRQRGGTLEELNLPTDRGSVARRADDLRKLSDDAFGMVVNETANETNAAAVGRVVGDKALHADIVRLLDRLNPKNETEREMVARKAATDAVVDTTGDLFGDAQVAESLYLERARVLDNTMKRVRLNKTLFKTLLGNAPKIEAAGNRLDAEANSKEAGENDRVLAYIQKEARTKGPISDALTEAARAVKDGRAVGQATDSFLANVRGRLESGRADGEGDAEASRPDTGARPERVTDERSNAPGADAPILPPVSDRPASVEPVGEVPALDMGVAEPREAAAPDVGEAPRPRVEITDNTDKSFLVRGLPASDVSGARTALGLPDKVQPIWNAKKGGFIVAQKHREKVQARLATLNAQPVAADATIDVALAEAPASEKSGLSAPQTEALPAAEPGRNNRAALLRKVAESQMQKAEADGPASTADLDVKRGEAGYRNMSFNPDRSAKSDVQGYVDDVNSFYREMSALAQTDEQKAILEGKIQDYKAKYIKHINAKWDASSRMASPMITGPSKFPTQRNQKRLDTYDKRTGEFLKWHKSARAAIKRQIHNARPLEQKQKDTWKPVERDVYGIAAAAKDAAQGNKSFNLSLLKSNFFGRMHTLAKSGDVAMTNKMLEKLRTVHTEAGLPNPIFTDRHKIWRLGDVAAFYAKKSETAQASDDMVIGAFEGAAVTRSPSDDRVRIEFVERVGPDVVSALKKEGWNWSRANSAWQRKNTPAAERSAKQIVGRFFPESAPEIAAPEPVAPPSQAATAETAQVSAPEPVAPPSQAATAETAQVSAPNTDADYAMSAARIAADIEADKTKAEQAPKPEMEPLAGLGMEKFDSPNQWIRKVRKPNGSTYTYKATRRWNGYDGRWEIIATRGTVLDPKRQITNPATKQLGTFANTADALQALRNDGLSDIAPATEATDAGEQSLIPGTREDQGRDTSRDQAEIAARQQQSKMQRLDQSRVEDDAGGLFGEPERNLFDRKEQREADVVAQERATFDRMMADMKAGTGNTKAAFAQMKSLSQARTSMIEALAADAGGVELKTPSGRPVAITRSQAREGGWRATYFDESGFLGHTEFKTKKEALDQAIREGYDVPAPGSLRAAVQAKTRDGQKFQFADKPVDGSPVAAPKPDRVAPVLPDLRKRLDKMGLKRVKLEADASMTAQGAFEAQGDAMRIVIGAALDPENTVRHEAIHAIKAMDLFTADEWKALTQRGRSLWMNQFNIAERYGDLDEAAQIEEAIAEGFAAWKPDAPASPIKAAFQKLRRFLRAVKEAFTGAGMHTVEDVFADVDSGRVGRRDSQSMAAHNSWKEQRQQAAAEKIAEPVEDVALPNDTPQDRQHSMLSALMAGTVDAGAGAATLTNKAMDSALQLLTVPLGGVDKAGNFRLGTAAFNELAKAIGERRVKNVPGLSFMDPIIETARHGLIDRYGLPDEYVEQDRKRGLRAAAIAGKGFEHVEKLLKSDMSAEEAAVLQAVLTGEAVGDADMQALAEPIRQAIDDIGLSAVEAGLLSREVYERNRGTYLSRSYAKYEGDKTGATKGISSFAQGRRLKIIGNQLKGRGLFHKVSSDQAFKSNPAFMEAGRGKPIKGEKVIWLDLVVEDQTPAMKGMAKPKGKVRDRVYWPADQAIPAKYDNYKNRGTWEVREEGKDTVTLWRDFTKEERTRMGEILDARYTIAKTFYNAANDLATGEFFNALAQNEEWVKTAPPEGVTPDEDPMRGEVTKRFIRGADLGEQWVLVPNTKIPKSDTARYAGLAGKYIRADLWRDMREMEIINTPSFWRELMTMFKLNKTARHPVVHMNNIMSNFMLADMADVHPTHIVAGIREMAKGGDLFREAQAAGAFGSDAVSQDMRKNILEPLLREIQQDTQGGKGNLEAIMNDLGPLARVKGIGRVTDRLWHYARKFDDGMIRAYQAEDEVFRMATYIRRREQGVSVEQAAVEARDQFLNYDIRAPWVNAARQTVLPFISYTYRAIPKVAETVAKRPWKLAKYAAVTYGLNALGYTVAPSEYDEEEERGSLRKEESGRTWLQTPRLIRMPWTANEDGDPVFLDIRRYIPAGDMFDLSQGDLPPWMALGGPVAIAGDLYWNRSLFTKKDITAPTDTFPERSAKRAWYLYQSMAPSAPWFPGSYHQENIIRAAKGDVKDAAGDTRKLSDALLGSVGIKARGRDVEQGYKNHKYEFERVNRDLAFERAALKRKMQRNEMSREEFEKDMVANAKKREKAREKYQKILDNRR